LVIFAVRRVDQRTCRAKPTGILVLGKPRRGCLDLRDVVESTNRERSRSGDNRAFSSSHVAPFRDSGGQSVGTGGPPRHLARTGRGDRLYQPPLDRAAARDRHAARLAGLSACVVSSDHLLHLHGMRWFRGTFATANLPRFFLDGVLALLLFAGSLHVDAKQLGQRRFLISLLVTTSVILSTLIFGTWHVADFRSDRRDRSACVVLRPQRYPRSYRRGGCRKSPAAGEPAGAPARRSSARAFLMTAPASYYSSSRSG
jgi:hypothetical protein